MSVATLHPLGNIHSLKNLHPLLSTWDWMHSNAIPRVKLTVYNQCSWLLGPNHLATIQGTCDDGVTTTTTTRSQNFDWLLLNFFKGRISSIGHGRQPRCEEERGGEGIAFKRNRCRRLQRQVPGVICETAMCWCSSALTTSSAMAAWRQLRLPDSHRPCFFFHSQPAWKLEYPVTLVGTQCWNVFCRSAH